MKTKIESKTRLILILDKSSSMNSLSNDLVKVVDNQIQHLARRSQELDQETRVSVYLFSDDTECAIYDKDVLRLPSMKGLYRASGMTNLIGATLKAIEDTEKIPQPYSEDAVIILAVSDGQNNLNSHLADKLRRKIDSLPENWTFGAFAPDFQAVAEYKRFGFPAANISLWNTSERGMNEEVGDVMIKVTDNYLVNRSKGVKGTKNLFDLKNITTAEIKQVLDEVPTNEYTILNVNEKRVIKEFVESWKIDFRQGAQYYQLTKPEKIQSHKSICVQHKRNGKLYTGRNARKMLGLPDHEVKVAPADFGDYDVFVQSTSVNRNLMPGTKLVVFK